jgi:thiol-disulfide isomerase/thioredoxin
MNRKVVVGAVVVVVAAVAGFALQRLLEERATIVEESASSAAATAAAGQEGSAGSTSAASANDEAAADGAASGDNEPKPRSIPETVPAISMPDRDGVSRSLASWKGQPVLINFWATWCGPCREEIPLLRTLRNERKAERLEVVGIAIDQREPVIKYARDIGIDYPILIGEKEGYAAAEAFGVALVLPFSVFADSQGRIVTLKIGELHADEAAYILDRVRDVDTRKLDLTAARQQIADRLREFAVERGKHASEKG